MRLHEWIFETAFWKAMQGESGGEDSPDSEVLARGSANVGAYIMGRNMFSPGRGEWDLGWKGWWGEDPPYHTPVFVLTHHAREPIPMQGGTTFNFVTDGIEHALELARAAAGEQNINIAGGASTINQYLHADLLDELTLHVVPVALGGGARLFENVGDPVLKPVEVIASPRVTHIKYEIEHKR